LPRASFDELTGKWLLWVGLLIGFQGWKGSLVGFFAAVKSVWRDVRRAGLVVILDYQFGVLFDFRLVKIFIIGLDVDQCPRTRNMCVRVDRAQSISVSTSSVRPPS
jgi:hypothetical protein